MVNGDGGRSVVGAPSSSTSGLPGGRGGEGEELGDGGGEVRGGERRVLGIGGGWASSSDELLEEGGLGWDGDTGWPEWSRQRWKRL